MKSQLQAASKLSSFVQFSVAQLSSDVFLSFCAFSVICLSRNILFLCSFLLALFSFRETDSIPKTLIGAIPCRSIRPVEIALPV